VKFHVTAIALPAARGGGRRLSAIEEQQQGSIRNMFPVSSNKVPANAKTQRRI
jgi:hypothetical protein